MEFSLTDEQQQLRNTVRKFAESEIAPHVMEWDEASTFPSELIPKLAELGLLGVIFPEEYGGAGMGYNEYAIIIEELSRVDGSIGIIVAAHNSLCTNHIYKFGNEEQKKKFVVPLAQGEKLGCWSLTEPEAGSDAGGTRTTATKSRRRMGAQRRENVHHQRPLRRCLRRHGRHRSAARNSHGISAFIIEKGTPGFRPGKKENKLGLRASDTERSYFHRLPRPGAKTCSARKAKASSTACRSSTAAASPLRRSPWAWRRAPTKRRCVYAKQRKQFGKPISEFQAIQFKLADMATEIDAARLLTYQAAWLADRAKASGDHAVRFTRESSMAKLFAGEVAVRVANEAVQIHGGYGFIKDYPVEKFYRDVKLCTIGEGTSEIQRLVIARQLLGSSR